MPTGKCVHSRGCCYSPHVVPVVKGEVVMVTVVFSSSFLSSPHFSLTVFSINCLQLLLSVAGVLHSLPSLSRSLLTQSSHRVLVFLTSFSLHFLGICSVCAVFNSHSFQMSNHSSVCLLVLLVSAACNHNMHFSLK